MAQAEGQQHPLNIYFWIWGLLFVFSAGSYATDFLPHGGLRMALILIFMVLKAGFIIAIFMHMKWERFALMWAILGPPAVLLVLIGLMLAAASTTAAGPISQTAYGARDVFALLSPFLLVVAVMFVPALDMLLAIIRRTRAGLSPFSPDKMHLHHRLLEIGHSHRRVVLLIYMWVGIVAFGAASTIFFDPRHTGMVMLGATAVAVVVTLVPLVRRREVAAESVYDEK